MKFKIAWLVTTPKILLTPLGLEEAGLLPPDLYLELLRPLGVSAHVVVLYFSFSDH